MNQISLQKNVDTYVEHLFIKETDGLTYAIKNSKKHNLPPIQITAVIGKFLYMQTKMIRAKKILEIGTLGGYSTLWFAQAVSEEGSITTIEHNEKYAAIAKENFINAKKDDVIELYVGDAKEILPSLSPSYDLVFIDANKEEYVQYLEESLKLSHPGTLIICDNVIRNGGVIEEIPEKEYYKKLADFNNKLANDPRLDSTIIPLTIPLTGRDYVDGISISIVK